MNDAKFSACRDSAFIVPYMYGELSTADCASFESHLSDCDNCADQFADISSARYEVYEWKKLEFEPLSTPQIEIPYALEPSRTSYSWFDKMRASFGQGWSAPGLAFAGLAIIAAFAAFVVVMRDGESGAVTTANLNVPSISNTAPVQPATIDDRTVEDEKSPDPVVPRRIRMEAPSKNEARPVNQIKRSPRRQLTETRPTSAQNLPRSAPSLNEFTDDEDTSLRLAELFDEIETSD